MQALRRISFTLVLVLTALVWGVSQYNAQAAPPAPAKPAAADAKTKPAAAGTITAPAHPAGCLQGQMRCITEADRAAAALRAKQARKGKITPKTAAVPGGTPNYFGPEANWANSPIIPKFVDSLPGLTSANPNTNGLFIPVARANKNIYSGSDTYRIQLNDYTSWKFDRSLPATLLRGYKDLNAVESERGNHYLGPIIIAQKDRPVRVLFTNALGTAGVAATSGGGDLFLPVDTTIMGANGPQNRATLHLHGGNTPWISDGTPHQWITPTGEHGASQQNVPDMDTPPSGSATFFWPNSGQSGRAEFYHDHALGTTRLNVYAGEAAGYVIIDPTEIGLVADGVLPDQAGLDNAATFDNPGGIYTYGVPLIIQDKTFIDTANVAAQDPTWPFPVVEGNLWFPHVYVPNQNPIDPLGVNATGRWDYGPWFWPPQDPSNFLGQPYACLGNSNYNDPDNPPICPGIPNPSLTPEAFMDTPIVNGQAYPYLTVEPKPYRFRILNASNDRSFNLQLYYAADTGGIATTNGTPGHPGTVCKGTGTASTCTEVNMVVAVAPTGTVCSTPTQTSGTGLALGALSGGNPLNGSGLQSTLEAPCWPTTWPIDNREGGVPDPAIIGPAIIQIGSEGGMLPAPVVIPSTPVGYENNRKNIVVLNVSTHGLILGPAERADIIVDFSSVPTGSTLILYNDSPVPMPAFDPRLDYYTGDPDQSDCGNATGGAPTTVAGYGPNTRTIMQFRVSGTTGTPVDLPTLSARLSAAYAEDQPKPVVPELAYNAAFPSIAGKNTYSHIQDNTLKFVPPVTPAPPYAGPACTSVAPQVCVSMSSKTIQELFTLDYGRMNATLGVELPLTRFNVQTTIPYGYIDPPTEFVTEGQPQLWKITHNGVDSHFIHFHLWNVQVINRVGWDGQIRPPDANELGWKDTVRMNPLEDIVVALQPVAPAVPFAVPASQRLLDVTMSEGAQTPLDGSGFAIGPPYFANVDPLGKQTTSANVSTNFGWEYVWHCHILGHEENDMMRPVIFTPKAAMISPTPQSTALPQSVIDATGPITFTWNANPEATSTFGSVTTTYGVSQSYLQIGSTPGGSDLYAGAPDTLTSVPATLSGNPADSSLAYARLFSLIDGVTLFNDYVYTVGLPVATVLPGNRLLEFGKQLVNTTSDPQYVTVTSSGLLPLTVTSIGITGTMAGEFAINSDTCAIGTPFTTSCTIGVTFTPSALKFAIKPNIKYPAALVIGTNDPNGNNAPVKVMLDGVGISPIAHVTPTTLAFGNQAYNTTSSSMPVTLSNSGNADLTITSITSTDGQFAQTNACGGSVAKGGNCTINVTFTPSALNAQSASLNIVTSDPVNPTLTVTLTGFGIAPPVGVSVSPTLGVGPGPQSFTATFTDANGPTDIVDTRILIGTTSVGPANACYVRYYNNRLYLQNDAGTIWLPSNLLPNAGTVSNKQCTLNGSSSSYTVTDKTVVLVANVTFKPAAFAGSKNVWIWALDSTNLNSGWVASGAWSVTFAGPVASLSPASLTFAVRPVSNTSPAQTITLTNKGAQALTINSIGLTGANPGDFALSSNSCGGSLAIGANCTVNVTFTPAAGGPRSASVTYNTNSTVNPAIQNVALSGSGSLAPAAGTLTPSSGSGASQAFTATYTDGNGAAAISDARLVINQTLGPANGCYVRYAAKRLYLMNDAGTSFGAGIPLPGTGTLSNTHCTVLGSGSSYGISGNTATLTANVQFILPAFAGLKSIWLYAAETTGLNSGFVKKGTWTVQGSGPQ